MKMNNKVGGLVDVDNVRNPKHYQILEGVESIDVIACSLTLEGWKGFCLGNITKYRLRAGKKGELEQDIAKADYYEELFEIKKYLCKGVTNMNNKVGGFYGIKADECNCEQALELKDCNDKLRTKIGELKSKSFIDDETVRYTINANHKLIDTQSTLQAESGMLELEVRRLSAENERLEERMKDWGISLG